MFQIIFILTIFLLFYEEFSQVPFSEQKNKEKFWIFLLYKMKVKLWRQMT